jgi:muconolactone D-isomerase
MEFLVRIEVDLPSELPERDALLLAERERARELRLAGKLVRIWSVPGRVANISLYEARDGSELANLLAPLHPWTTTEVDELAPHPLEDEGSGA